MARLRSRRWSHWGWSADCLFGRKSAITNQNIPGQIFNGLGWGNSTSTQHFRQTEWWVCTGSTSKISNRFANRGCLYEVSDYEIAEEISIVGESNQLRTLSISYTGICGRTMGQNRNVRPIWRTVDWWCSLRIANSRCSLTFFLGYSASEQRIFGILTSPWSGLPTTRMRMNHHSPEITIRIDPLRSRGSAIGCTIEISLWTFMNPVWKLELVLSHNCRVDPKTSGGQCPWPRWNCRNVLLDIFE